MKNNKLYVLRFVPYNEIKRQKKVFVAKTALLGTVLGILVIISTVYAARLIPPGSMSKLRDTSASQSKVTPPCYVLPAPDEETRVKADRLKAIIYEDWSAHNYIPSNAELDTVYINDGNNICYLTFDDGPSEITPDILDILDEYDIKATFFVTGAQIKKYPKIVKKIYKKGHTLGNHSFSHIYNTVYESGDSFENELLLCKNSIDTAIGKNYNNLVFRFPGGFSSLTNADTKKLYSEILDKNGYKYIDWSCLTGDSNTTEPTFEYLMDTLRFSIGNTKTGDIVVLMHDSAAKKITADSLGDIIKYISSLGYKFKALKN